MKVIYILSLILFSSNVFAQEIDYIADAKTVNCGPVRARLANDGRTAPVLISVKKDTIRKKLTIVLQEAFEDQDVEGDVQYTKQVLVEEGQSHFLSGHRFARVAVRFYLSSKDVPIGSDNPYCYSPSCRDSYLMLCELKL